jgi:hypothetical protein
MAGGDFTFVTAGTEYVNTGWVMTDPVTTVGISNVVWVQFSGAGTYTAGTGLTLTGSVFSITNTTVAAATYGNGDSVASFTVNAQGQLTAASNVAIAANAANLTGSTLASGITTSSLTTVGTLGNLEVTSNITSGNANLGNAARANFFIGDGSGLTNIPIGTSLTNGTSSVTIPVANGNVNTTVGGTANVLVVTSTGANITGTLNVTGNTTVGNLITGAGTGGNISGANVITANLFSGTSLIVSGTANLSGALTSGDLADAVGYKGLPQNSQGSAYTLAFSDMGKHIDISTGGVVIPPNSGVGSVEFPIGATIVIFNDSASTQTISTTDTLRQAGTTNTGTRTLAAYGVATCLKVAATVWVVTGNVT